MQDSSHYSELRQRSLDARRSLSLDAGVSFWREALQGSP
jgi:hypothetical protein